MQIVDTHAHLDEEAFATDIDEVIARCTDQQIRVITIGTTADSSQRAVELADKYGHVYAAVGIQPNYAAEAKPDDWDRIVELSQSPKVVAIGETGLDRYWDYTPFDRQQDYFDRHLQLARERNLPFIVHCRDAEDDTVAQLRNAAAAGSLRGVMHSFCGTSATAESCLDLGLYLSFAGMLTFKRNTELRETASRVPLDRVLIETDAPYLAPEPFRGKRNEPAHVLHTLHKLAELHGLTVEQMAAQTTTNAQRLFRLPAV